MNDERSEFEELADVGGHPRGTLAIVAIYGALFVVGWLVLYFFVFVPRGRQSSAARITMKLMINLGLFLSSRM